MNGFKMSRPLLGSRPPVAEKRSLLWQGSGRESGVETVEYVGLSAAIMVLIGSVVYYLNTEGGQVLVRAFRDVIQVTISGFQRGW